jgi:hypothetical protein
MQVRVMVQLAWCNSPVLSSTPCSQPECISSSMEYISESASEQASQEALQVMDMVNRRPHCTRHP